MYKVQLDQAIFPAQVPSPFEAETVRGLMRLQSQRLGDKSALEEVLPDASIGRCWTYRSLHEEAEMLARALASRHPRETRIAVFSNNRPEWILLELAAAYAGVIIVTVNPSLRAAELHYILTQSGAEAIYYAPKVRGSNLRDIIDAALELLESPEKDIALYSMDDRKAMYEGSDADELPDTLPETSPDDIAQIQYTSGTTGFPKGALLKQSALVRNGREILLRAGVKENSRAPGLVPLFHTSGCGIMVLGNLGCGTTLLLPADFDPSIVLALFEHHGANFLAGVPTMLVAVLDAAEQSGTDLSAVTGIMCGGAMVAAELNRRAKKICGRPVQITYGLTESAPGIAGTWPDDSDEDLCDTIGQPYPFMDVSIRNANTDTVANLNTQGEICVRGYNVMPGYNNNPEASREAVDEDGWLHTGDLGSMDERGYIKITGRVKDMIIRGGENLFPAEIENALLAHPVISDVAVVGVPDDKWGELVACFVRPQAGEKPTPSELKAFVRERLSPQKTPSFWIYVDEWPLTGSGKIRKFILREQFVDDQFEVFTA